MRELDKNKIYDLSELTSEERIEVLKKLGYTSYFYNDIIAYEESVGWFFSREHVPTANAKEIFYNLENVQVDCRELTSTEIKEMYFIVENKNYNTKKDLYRCKGWFYFSYNSARRCFSENRRIDNDKTTITYEKFMELFGYKEKSQEFKNLIEVLNEELTEEAYKETEYEVKYIAEKPKQYQAHYNNENGSLYKIATDLGLNHWEFDVFKRLVRCRKKNQFKEDLQKIKDTIDIYLNEYSE